MTALDAASAAPRLPLLAAVAIAPRRTMRWMLDHPERRQSFAVVVAAVVSYSLRDLKMQGIAEAAAVVGTSAALFVTLMVLAVGVTVATLMFFVVAAGATAAGRMLGGSGTFGAVRTALAWGLAPQVWALFYRLPVLLLWPNAVATLQGGNPGLRIGSDTITFTPIFAGQVPLHQIAVIMAFDLLILCWYFVVGSQTLAEAQGFSSWRGLANLLLAVVLPFVAVMVIAAAAVLAIKTT